MMSAPPVSVKLTTGLVVTVGDSAPPVNVCVRLPSVTIAVALPIVISAVPLDGL